MSDLIERDLNHVWHPCSQMKDFETFPPLAINKADGCYLYTTNGQKIIDATSSWWCKSLGHNHPRLKQALIEQLDKFEHVIGANTTHQTIVEFCETLTALTPSLSRVFFASDGSCSVEIAMKLALHAKQLQGLDHKSEFVALSGGYHGETLATLAVSDLGIYKAPYKDMALNCHFLQDLPYVNGIDAPVWNDCSEHWQSIESQLDKVIDKVCAIVVEPVLQGAGGMKLYSPDLLRRLRDYTKANDVYLICDEIMTGLGRTGKWFASQYAEIIPDMMCLSKGLTSGMLPLSCVLINSAIYELFYDDYATGKSFLHSHTYSGNALAVSVALATIREMHTLNIEQKATKLGHELLANFNYVAEKTGKIANIRQLGAMVAGDLVAPPKPRMGYQVFQHATRLGALLRPLGNTLYWLPPLTMNCQTVEELSTITIKAINNAYQ